MDDMDPLMSQSHPSAILLPTLQQFEPVDFTIELPLLPNTDLLKSEYVNYPVIEDLADEIKEQIYQQKHILDRVFRRATSIVPDQCSSFSFTDANGNFIAPEILDYFGKLKVVYASAIVAANSTSKLLEEGINHHEPSKCLLVFAEVGAITTINELGKVKLITVRTKPNQLLSPGHHHELKLSLPPIEQIFDAESPEGSKLLSEQPARIYLKDFQEDVSMVSVQLQQDSLRQFTAKTSPCYEDCVDLGTCQLVTASYDTVVCQKVPPSYSDDQENFAPMSVSEVIVNYSEPVNDEETYLCQPVGTGCSTSSWRESGYRAKKPGRPKKYNRGMKSVSNDK